MFEFIFEIYDKRYHSWYLDYKTSDIDIAEWYFDGLLKKYDEGCIRMITRIKEC